MSSTGESDTEILLGNRHLLAIFFVLAVLLGIAFTGGYMVGRNSSDKKLIAGVSGDPAASTNTAANSRETITLPAPEPDNSDAPPKAEESSGGATTQEVKPIPPPPPAPVQEEQPLGATRKPAPEREAPPAAVKPKPEPKPKAASFTGPQSGQTFLQVMAVGRTEAVATAEVLSKKGFHAHAVPKPGSKEIYRVLVGPLVDSGDLSSTRERLRRDAGFSEIIVQRY